MVRNIDVHSIINTSNVKVIKQLYECEVYSRVDFENKTGLIEY